MEDGGVEAGLLALVQEHRVEHVADGREGAEGDVGQAEHGADAGQLGLHQADALDGLDAVAVGLLLAGHEGQGEAVEEEVLGSEAVALDGEVADAAGDRQLALAGAGLALLVDGEADHAGAVLPGQAS